MLIARNDGENKWNKQSGSIFTVNFQNPSVHVKKILHKPIAVSGPDLGTMHHGTNMHNTFVLPSFPQPLTKKTLCWFWMYVYTYSMYVYIKLYIYTIHIIKHSSFAHLYFPTTLKTDLPVFCSPRCQWIFSRTAHSHPWMFDSSPVVSAPWASKIYGWWKSQITHLDLV